MRVYSEQTFPAMSIILMQAAEEMAAISGHKFVVSDMVISLSQLHEHILSEDSHNPFYIAIRTMGVEAGDKKHCLERCKGLGYPVVIFKVEKDNPVDFKMTVRLSTQTDGNWLAMEQEFDSI